MKIVNKQYLEDGKFFNKNSNPLLKHSTLNIAGLGKGIWGKGEKYLEKERKSWQEK